MAHRFLLKWQLKKEKGGCLELLWNREVESQLAGKGHEPLGVNACLLGSYQLGEMPEVGKADSYCKP